MRKTISFVKKTTGKEASNKMWRLLILVRRDLRKDPGNPSITTENWKTCWWCTLSYQKGDFSPYLSFSIILFFLQSQSCPLNCLSPISTYSSPSDRTQPSVRLHLPFLPPQPEFIPPACSQYLMSSLPPNSHPTCLRVFLLPRWNTMTKANLRRKSFIWLLHYYSSLKEIRTETQTGQEPKGRNWYRDHGGMWFTDLLHRLC